MHLYLRAITFKDMMKKKEFITRTYSALIFGIIFLGIFIFLPPLFFSILLTCILLYILIFEWNTCGGYKSRYSMLLTPLYLILPFVLLIVMNESARYHDLLYYLFALVFAHDVGAYVVGSLIGYHKIIPTISPNKSWEGLLGGLIFIIITLKIMLPYFGSYVTTLELMIISSSVCLAAFCGDLFESWLKRKAGIKDAGSILPGHGGLLDRFDSIIFVTFLFFCTRNTLTCWLLG